MLRLWVLLAALAMPVVNYLALAGVLGPDVGEVSNRFPTLIVAAGYAFSIWGPIFALVVAFGVYQMLPASASKAMLERLRIPAAIAFTLTAVWTPIFIHGYFCTAALVLALTCAVLTVALLRADASWNDSGSARWLVWPCFSVFTAWVSLAAFLDVGQVLVAYRVDTGPAELTCSVLILLAAASLLLFVNQRLRGNLLYVATALWALLAICVAQTQKVDDAAHTTGWLALGIAAVLLAHYAWLKLVPLQSLRTA
ncbi:MAG: hypothetical protein ABI411_20130 [Tahibacter sp.]